LRPGDSVRFDEVSMTEAREAYDDFGKRLRERTAILALLAGGKQS
jgi:hypothetical protein